jgi:predicted flap endonuclease-1-like 5' DNA nuclease
MAYKIQEVEGIGPAKAEQLSAAGIATTDDLLRLCANKAGRVTVAEKCGVGEGQILKWANMADLMRISGVAGEYAELLKVAGVDTIKELRTRNAENLATKVAEINKEKNLTRQVPTAPTITKWIEAAKSLDPVITH